MTSQTPYGGNSYELTLWDPINKKCEGICWLATANLENNDIIIIPSRKGTMRLQVFNVKWLSNVDDMYSFNAKPEEKPCECVIREEIHYELPEQPTEYIIEHACPLHEYDARGLQKPKTNN